MDWKLWTRIIGIFFLIISSTLAFFNLEDLIKDIIYGGFSLGPNGSFSYVIISSLIFVIILSFVMGLLYLLIPSEKIRKFTKISVILIGSAVLLYILSILFFPLMSFINFNPAVFLNMALVVFLLSLILIIIALILIVIDLLKSVE